MRCWRAISNVCVFGVPAAKLTTQVPFSPLVFKPSVVTKYGYNDVRALMLHESDSAVCSFNIRVIYLNINSKMGEEDYLDAVIIENGSATIKAGFAGDDHPRAMFRSVLGSPKVASTVGGANLRDLYVGDEAWGKRSTIDLRSPIKRGTVTSWDDMEKIWQHTFHNELRVAPEEHPVLLTDTRLHPKHREKMAEIMFEKFDVPCMDIRHKAVLSLRCSGRDTGVVLQSGAGVSSITPVYSMHIISHAVEYHDVNGSDLTQNLVHMLRDSGYSFKATAEREIVRDIKHKLCYAALHFDGELKNFGKTPKAEVEKIYKLPDDSIVKIGDQRFRCPEVTSVYFVLFMYFYFYFHFHSTLLTPFSC